MGLSQDGGRNLQSSGSTVAHELGHIFNMNHDDGRKWVWFDAVLLFYWTLPINYSKDPPLLPNFHISNDISGPMFLVTVPLFCPLLFTDGALWL